MRTMDATLHHLEGTPRLADAHVVIVGLGGLGTPVARALAAAGVGRLTVWDPDRVERSNLPRQLLYDAADLGRLKVEAARAWLAARHPATTVVPVPRRFEAADAPRLAGAAAVVDGTDSVGGKFAVNDAAVAAGVPLVHAGATGLRAQVTTILPGRTACYRCVFEAPPPDDDVPACVEAGVLAPLVTLAGALQAADALRLAAGVPPALAGRLFVLDAARGAGRAVPLYRRPDCPACAARHAAESMRIES